MKRPKLRKASKRMSCSKRYKIQKKVREHNRKLRKEAKKKGISKHVKKDPGVPSSAPFKEEVLREAEQKRLQIEEEKQKKREAVKEARAQKRKNEKESTSKEGEPGAKKARQEVKKRKEKQPAIDKSSKKHLCSELNKVIDASDVLIEVLDARDPLGCRCPQLEEAVLQREGNKKLLLLLNKIDLIPRVNLEQWVKYLRKDFPVVVFKASTHIKERTVQDKKNKKMAFNEAPDISRAATCCGSASLTELLSSFALKTKGDAALKVGVVGFPNVGKSSVINSMKEILACKAGVQRGITKFMQEVSISKTVKMIDSPGVVALTSNPPASMALRSLQVEESQESVLEAVRGLLKQCDKIQIMLLYNVPDYRNSLEFLSMLAKRRGYLQKGGLPNTEEAAVAFLTDCTGAKLSYHCKAPGNHSLPSYMSDTVAAEMQSDWDLDQLNKGNRETIKGVKFRGKISSISFTSAGPTAGLLSFTETSEEKPSAATETDDKTEPEPSPEDMDENKEPTKPLKSSLKKQKGSVQMTRKTVHIDIGPQADDAYDFNTDFK